MKIERPFFLGMLFVMTLFVQTAFAAPEKAAWEFAGWYGGGMYPNLIADPNVEGRLYLTSDVAGIWRSDNRGDEWTFMNEGLDNLYVAVLAVAPSDSNILYAGTRQGIVRSDNAGKNWQPLENAHKKITFKKPASYRSLVVDRQNPAHIFAGDQKGLVYESMDFGQSWETVGKKLPFDENVLVTALQYDEQAAALYVGSKKGLVRFKRDDESWKKERILEKPVSDLFFDAQSRTLYSASENKLLATTDQGASWETSALETQIKVSRVSLGTASDGSKILVIGTHRDWNGSIYLSTDQGKNWENIERNIQYDETGNPTRVWMKGFQRPNALTVDPFDPSIIYFTDSWGVYRTTDGGNSWIEKIEGAPNASGSDIRISDKGWIYVATMDQGVLVSKDDGVTYSSLIPGKTLKSGRHAWRVLPIKDEAGEDVLIVTEFPWDKQTNRVLRRKAKEPLHEVTIGTTTQNTMWGKGYIRALAMNPNDSRELYLGLDGDDGGGFFSSSDGGFTWTRSTGQPKALKIYNALAVDPAQPNDLYWGACGDQGGVYKTENKGAEWKRVLKSPNCIFDLTVSRTGIAYAGGTNGAPVLYRSSTSGKEWKFVKEFETGTTTEAITLHPQDENQLFVGTVNWSEKSGGSIYYSSNGGASWLDITRNLPNSTGPAAMAINPQTNDLFALLYGGSVYKMNTAVLNAE